MSTIAFTRTGANITVQKDSLPALTLQAGSYVLDPSNDNTVLRVTLPSGGRKNYYLTDTYTVQGAAFSGTTAAELATELRTKIFFPSGGSQVLASNVPLSHTGSTTKTVVLTATIPANTIGPNGSLWFKLLFVNNSSASLKEVGTRINGVEVGWCGVTTTTLGKGQFELMNQNSLTSQVSQEPSNGAYSFGMMSANLKTYALDTSQDMTLTLDIKLANAADSLTIRSFIVIAVN